MKKIIALRGKSNSGKTSTFILLARLMIQSGYQLLEGNFLEREHRIRGRDFWQIFEKNGKIIGVVSSGDVYKVVRGQLDSLKQDFNCEIAFCTCRSFDKVKPGTVTAVEETPGFSEPYFWKNRAAKVEDRDNDNMATAKNLLYALEVELKNLR